MNIQKYNHYLNAMGITQWRERFAENQSTGIAYALCDQNQHSRIVFIIDDTENTPENLKFLHAVANALSLTMTESAETETAPTVIIFSNHASELAQQYSANNNITAKAPSHYLHHPAEKANLWKTLQPLT